LIIEVHHNYSLRQFLGDLQTKEHLISSFKELIHVRRERERRVVDPIERVEEKEGVGADQKGSTDYTCN